MKNKQMTFEILPWDYDDKTSRLIFSYECSVYGHFTEQFIFTPIKHDITKAAPYLNLLSWLVGLSYYKAAAAPTIIGPLYTDHFKEAIKSFYQKGLGEFFIRNELSYPYKQDFTFSSIEKTTPTTTSTTLSKKALCAFGGGKDSYTALHLLKQANIETDFLSVISSTRIEKTLQDSSLAPLSFIHRVLDPKIIDVNKQGALNGHIPITAILSVLFAVYAVLNDYTYIVFANEHSASEATIDINGLTANHQYSKSYEAEQILRKCFDVVEEHPIYFSILRPFSEIYIASLFSQFKDAHPLFLSCNKNFQITQSTHQSRWCHTCPKCAFVFLILAPFLKKEALFNIFNHSLLNDPKMIDIYKELLGLSDKKPWECIGTISECRAVFYHLSHHADWKDHHIIQELLPEILKHESASNLIKSFQDHLDFRGPHFIPEEIYTHVS